MYIDQWGNVCVQAHELWMIPNPRPPLRPSDGLPSAPSGGFEFVGDALMLPVEFVASLDFVWWGHLLYCIFCVIAAGVGTGFIITGLVDNWGAITKCEEVDSEIMTGWQCVPGLVMSVVLGIVWWASACEGADKWLSLYLAPWAVLVSAWTAWSHVLFLSPRQPWFDWSHETGRTKNPNGTWSKKFKARECHLPRQRSFREAVADATDALRKMAEAIGGISHGESEAE